MFQTIRRNTEQHPKGRPSGPRSEPPLTQHPQRVPTLQLCPPCSGCATAPSASHQSPRDTHTCKGGRTRSPLCMLMSPQNRATDTQTPRTHTGARRPRRTGAVPGGSRGSWACSQEGFLEELAGLGIGGCMWATGSPTAQGLWSRVTSLSSPDTFATTTTARIQTTPAVSQGGTRPQVAGPAGLAFYSGPQRL